MIAADHRAQHRQALQDTLSAGVAVGLLSDPKPFRERVKALEKVASAS